MKLEQGSKLFVRIDYKIEGKELTHQDYEDCLIYLKNVARERYFIGGVFSNVDGAMCLIEAENFEEAQEIARNDPLIERGLYRYELFEWNLVVLSGDTGE